MLHCVQVVWEEKAMTALRSALLLLFVCYCRAREDCSSCHDPRVSVPCARIYFWPHSVTYWFALRTQHFTIVPSNVKCLAEYISPKADIRKLIIHFKATCPSELFLRVPIETPESAIVITLGIDSSYFGRDYEMKFTLHDSNSFIHFEITNPFTYQWWPPCYFYEVESEHDTLVSEGTKMADTFKFTLLPWERLGYCETAQEGGYVNVGKFRKQLDPLKPLYLELIGQHGVELNSIYYISIESI